MKVPGSPLARGNRAAQARVSSYAPESTLTQPNPRRPRLSRPFPCPSLRYYYRRPSLLAVALESDFWIGRRAAA